MEVNFVISRFEGSHLSAAVDSSSLATSLSVGRAGSSVSLDGSGATADMYRILFVSCSVSVVKGDLQPYSYPCIELLMQASYGRLGVTAKVLKPWGLELPKMPVRDEHLSK